MQRLLAEHYTRNVREKEGATVVLTTTVAMYATRSATAFISSIKHRLGRGGGHAVIINQARRLPITGEGK
jgi:hypothetical protein